MRQKNGFRKRTEAKKQVILQAARTLFFKKGPESTTIAEIAALAKVSQVSLYSYFESKDRLLEIVVRQHLESSLVQVERIFEQDIPFKEKLSRFFALGDATKDDITDVSLANFDWQNPKLQVIYDRFSAERQVPFLIRFIEMGKSEGVIKKELSTEAVMVYLSANMSIYKDPGLLKKGKDYLASLSHLFFYGLLGK